MKHADVDLARVLDEMSDAVLVVNQWMSISYANRAAQTLLTTAQLEGRPLTDFIPERFRAAHSAGFARYVQSGIGSLVGGHPIRVPVLRPDGAEADVELTLARTSSPNGELLLVGVLRDLTLTRVLEQQAGIARYLQASMEVAEELQKAATVSRALPVLLPALCERLDWAVAALWEVRGDVLCNVDVWQVSGPLRSEFSEQTRSLEFQRGGGVPGRVWTLGRPIHIESLQADPTILRRDAAGREGLLSCLAFPLIGGGEVLGVVELYSAERRRPDPGLIDVVTGIGKQLGQFIERIKAEDDLRKGEERYRSLAEAFALDVFRATGDGELVTDMPRWRAFTGQRPEELLGMGWVDAIGADDQARVAALWRHAVATATPYAAEFSLITETGGERVVLARAVPIMDAAVVHEWVGTSTDVTEHRHAERAAVALADTLQRSLLPPHMPHLPGFELSARYRAGGEGLQVGGDFYDVFAVNPDTWVIVIGDVCGKGAEAASVTALARYTVRAAAMHELQPAGIASALNDALLRTDDRAPFLTAVVAVLWLGLAAPSLEVVCAGHPPPLLRTSAGTLRELGRPGDLLGVFETVELHDVAVDLAAGDTVVFYTDGVTEARNSQGVEFGADALAAAVAACHGGTAETTCTAVIDAVVDHRGDRGGDDVALLAMRCL